MKEAITSIIVSVAIVVLVFLAARDIGTDVKDTVETAAQPTFTQTETQTNTQTETETQTETTETQTETAVFTTTQQSEKLGMCRISAYCGCPNCCGAWSTGGVIKGASGRELCEGTSCACNGFDFGTELLVDGVGTFIVHDRVACWVDDELGKTVDIYFDDHDSATDFGLKWADVEILK